MTGYGSLNRTKGLTLIELMIVVVIVGILGSIAYPSYTRYVAEGTRSEAQAALMRIANLQEQRYLDFRSYTADMTELGLNADPFVTEQGHYKVDATVSAGNYTLTATAQGVQATRDSACASIKIDATGKKYEPECW